MEFRQDLNELEIACSSFDEDKGCLQRFGDWYFEIKGFEKSGRVYERLGVKAFARLLRDREWLSDNFGDSFFFRDRYDNMKKIIEATKSAEELRTYISLGFTLLSGYQCGKGHIKESVSFALMNLFICYYPIMAMRYTRNRALKILEKRNGNRA